MKFKSQYDKSERVYSFPGDDEKIVYAGEYDNNGRFVLVEKGKESMSQYINSFADSVDINVIISKFENGEIDSFNLRPSMYGDFTQMPKTYAEMLNRVAKAEEWFNTFPNEIKEKFNFSAEEFISSIDSPDFLAKLGVEEASENTSGNVDSASENTSGNVDSAIDS